MAMAESKASMLRRRYPTMQSLSAAIAASGSKTELGRQLRIARQTINDHTKWLRQGAVPVTEGLRTCNCDMTNGELDKRIKEMFGSEYEDVKVYRMTDGFQSGQIGTEGLEYIRTDVSRTAMSLWVKGGN